MLFESPCASAFRSSFGQEKKKESALDSRFVKNQCPHALLWSYLIITVSSKSNIILVQSRLFLFLLAKRRTESTRAWTLKQHSALTRTVLPKGTRAKATSGFTAASTGATSARSAARLSRRPRGGPSIACATGRRWSSGS